LTKEELRGQMRAMRAELTGDKRDAAEQQAVDHMMAFLRQKRPRRFYPFVSCRTEIDTLQLLQRVWKELPEIAVAVPCVEEQRMQFYEVRAMNDLHRGTMGILEPAGAEPVRAEDGVMLVPGLAYDERGYRVGYGAGFYDRYFAEYGLCKPNAGGVLKIGYAFSFQLVQRMEAQEHDVALDALMTEKGINFFG
jgi:5-formyltetrahydrofolate cyclo-ligase